MFKGRFFSSKKSDVSSPDGSSNSPRSIGSNSPIRSDKKMGKSSSSTSKDNSPATPTSISSLAASFKDKKKDSKGKESIVPNSNSPGKSGLGGGEALSSSKLKSLDGKETGPPTAVSVSPILASSLGLNKIKTRSGPLPQESFFSYGSRDKGSSLGASNLSKPQSSSATKSAVGKEDKRAVESSGWVDNGSNSDHMSTENAARSRNQSPRVSSRLQNGESSSEAGIL